jgi:hypothetical protein
VKEFLFSYDYSSDLLIVQPDTKAYCDVTSGPAVQAARGYADENARHAILVKRVHGPLTAGGEGHEGHGNDQQYRDCDLS